MSRFSTLAQAIQWFDMVQRSSDERSGGYWQGRRPSGVDLSETDEDLERKLVRARKAKVWEPEVG